MGRLAGKETHVILRHCIPKTIILPRQARDKHTESSKRERRFLILIANISGGEEATTLAANTLMAPNSDSGIFGNPVRKTPLFAPFIH
jgi:hypothetical protein